MGDINMKDIVMIEQAKHNDVTYSYLVVYDDYTYKKYNNGGNYEPIYTYELPDDVRCFLNKACIVDVIINNEFMLKMYQYEVSEKFRK